MKTLSIALFWALWLGLVHAACSPGTVDRLKLETTKVAYIAMSTVSMEPIIVKTLDSSATFVSATSATVVMRGPTQLSFSPGTTPTLNAGVFNFSGMSITNPPRGTYFIEFDLQCTPPTVDRTERIEITIMSGTATSVGYYLQPEASISNYGVFTVRPQLAYYDAYGNIADMPNTDTWTLLTNDSALNAVLVGNTFTPTTYSGSIATFPDLYFNIQPGATWNGRTFNFFLASIGSQLGTTITFNTNITMKIAECQQDFSIVATGTGGSPGHYIMPKPSSGSTVNFALRGYNFPSSASTYGKCKWGPTEYPLVFKDVCNIACTLPVLLGTYKLLSISVHGISYEALGYAAIVDTAHHVLFEPANITVHRQSVLSTRFHVAIVDQYNIAVGDQVTSSGNHRLRCFTDSYFGAQKWIKSTYYDPYTAMYRTPDYQPRIVNGNATLELAFSNNLEADRHTFCCNVSGAISSRTSCLHIDVVEDCVSPPVVTAVSTSGCAVAGDDLINCKTQGNVPVTVRGSNFGTGGTQVRIGPYYCETVTHDSRYPTRIIVATNCRGAGLNHTVSIIRPAEKVYGNWPYTYNFALSPVISSIVGCTSDFYPSTANCDPSGNMTVMIRGSNFGSSGAKVYFYYYEPSSVTRIRATIVTHLNSAGTIINATNFSGTGVRFSVAVETAVGELTINPLVTMSFIASAYVSCPKVAGIQCNAKGTCDNSVGVCTSCFANPTDGYWAGVDCGKCAPDYFGANCQSQCPMAGGFACSGPTQGTCFAGLTGNGTCKCVSGYAGNDCASICPGGVSSPCSNHGTCVQSTAACTCHSDSTRGYWNGTMCNVCQNTYVDVGSSCLYLCPTAITGSKCTGNGTCAAVVGAAACTCQANSCGADCGIYNYTGTECQPCPFGKWGSICSNTCPGTDFTIPHVCSGHGTCSDGKQGTGICTCQTGYGGTDCASSCAFDSSSSSFCAAVLSQGTCDTNTLTCTCTSGYAGSSCSIVCPKGGTSNTVCSSHGSCLDGSSRDGTCTCNSGYTDTDCSKDCPGGVSTPCSNHGICNKNQTCSCHATALQGFWSGSECSVCASGWYATKLCNLTCPLTSGLVCANNGVCVGETAANCQCYDTSVKGHWAEPTCANCKPGYYATECKLQCPGGACNACSKHGQCFDGTTGNGTCACHFNSTAGYWSGDKCDSCATTYYGTECKSQCPFYGTLVCGGHGTCSDGIAGSGVCSCVRDVIYGYWDGSACEGCLNGFYGPDCNQECPGTDSSQGTTCSNHGTCDSLGNCTCTTGYGSYDCSVGCHFEASTGYCGGHGTCFDGATRNGTCGCYQSSSQGFWSNENCTTCLYGYYGQSCIQECPRSYGEFCGGSARGTCETSTDYVSGWCQCAFGWSGDSCSRPCDGGHVNPCSGHGYCNATSGHCTCYSSEASGGFWGGRNCSRCDTMYSGSEGSGCTKLCPSTAENPDVPCNGEGDCLEGECKCNNGWCGQKCEKKPFDCTENCPTTTRWGSLCDQLCNGGGTCTGNGKCDHGKKGKGTCECFNGFFGDGCEKECPGGATNPCTGHGTCTKGECKCNSGWALSDCSTECPGGFSNPCTGNGTCQVSTATCTCYNNMYAGLACQLPCPGNKTCSGHGTCVQNPASCNCDSDNTKGFWTGTGCDVCQAGYYGPKCLKVCVHGYTSGKTCMCHEPWSGEDCSIACPGDPTGVQNATRCSGHGKCVWGHTKTKAQCLCDNNYYASDCNVECTKQKCASHPYYLVNGQCHNETGECTCMDDSTNGHWADTSTRCTTCKLFWYGDTCLRRCPCLQHGGCDKNTGACLCFDTDALGHWDGTSCERCKAGFLGARCTGKDVVITRQKPCSSLASVNATSSFILVDNAYDVVMTGASPLIVCNLTSRAFINTYDFGRSPQSGIINKAIVVAGRLYDTNNIILTLSNTTHHQTARIRRERNPTFTVQQYSTPYSTNAALYSRVKSHTMAVQAATDSSIVLGRPALSTRRRLTAIHQFQANITVATVVVNALESYNVMSSGLVTKTTNLAVEEQADFGQYFDQILCADITSTVLISPALLLLGGEKNGNFQLIAVPVPISSATNLTIQNLTQPIALSSYCIDGKCKAIAKIVADGTYFVMTMLTLRFDSIENKNYAGAGVVRLRYTQLFSGGRIESNAILDNYDYSTVINVTAMLLDPLGSAGFVAMNVKSPDTDEPSTIYKFDLLDLQVYGSVRFQKVVTSLEIVTGLSKDDDARILFATVPLAGQINVVPLNLYAVTKVFPAIADTAGGTVVTIEGEGFINDASLQCNFNGTLVAAKFISSREALCTAPVGGDERCEGVPLEITIRKDQWTKNDTPLRRVSSARITKVQTLRWLKDGIDNAYGNLTGGDVVVLDGLGFQDSAHLACRFTSAAGGETQIAPFADRDYAYSLGKQGIKYNKARFINATRMECDQPAFAKPTKGTSSLEVTLDGTVYSRTGQEFEVVGTGVGLSTFREQSLGKWVADTGVQFASSERVDLKNISLFIVDEMNQRLRNLDGSNRNIEMTLHTFKKQILDNTTKTCDNARTVQGNPVFHSTGKMSQISSNGRADFGGMYLLKPPAGTYTIRFTDTSTGWYFDHVFSIVVGAPYKIRVCTEPSLLTKNTNPTLKIQPEVYLEDASGNQLPTEALTGIKIEAVYERELTKTTAISAADQKAKIRLGVPVTVEYTKRTEVHVGKLQDNYIVFEGLEMTGLFGKTYSINFTAPLEPTIQNATSRPVAVDFCESPTDPPPGVLTYFSKPGTSECFVCPEGGKCDGTSHVDVASLNYWRPSAESYKFYSCEEPYGAGSCIPPNGTCRSGYTGPRCSVCERGYGRMGVACHKCEKESIIVLYMVLLLVITLAFISVMVFTSFSMSMNDMLPVIIKIAINHLQIAARIQEIVYLPNALQYLFYFQVQLSELIRFDIVSTECPPLELTTYDQFYIAISLPASMMFLFGVCYVGLAIVRQVRGIGIKYEKITITSEQAKKIRRDRVMLIVANFMARMKGAAAEHAGDISRDDLRPQFFSALQYFFATAFIILFLVYPSVLQWCVSMWSCDALVYDDAESLHTIEYLKRDRSIICTDKTHIRVKIGALSAALAYGLIVPVAAILFVWRHWSIHGRVHARRLYAFLTLGFDISTWWWESIVTLRKAAIVFIIIFINDTILRTYLAMWVMTLALGAHGWFQPYDPRHPVLYYLEGLAITTIVVTLNLSLLFQFDLFATGTDANLALVIFLLIINGLLLIAFLFFIGRYLVLRIQRWLAKDEESTSDTQSTRDEFIGVDRHIIQQEGISGALRRASHKALGLDSTDSTMPQKVGKQIDIRNIPKSDHETPLERVKRIEAERARESQRDLHMRTQAELEKELEELRERMIRAQALAAAEEAVIARHPEVAEMRAKHEEELYRLMDEIRKERGDFAVGDAAAIIDKDAERPKSSESAFEMNFDDEK